MLDICSMNLNQTYNSEMKSDVYLETGVDKHVEGKKFNHSNVQLFVTLALVALEWC